MIAFALLFYSAIFIAMSASEQKSVDLTKITWAHAVNSKNLLTKTLADKSINMIEADVVVGTLKNDSTKTMLPVMAHPPANSSDLSLSEFINTIIKHNRDKKDDVKGFKLDFKSIEAFENSSLIINGHLKNITCPFWINADVLVGPGANNKTKPVDINSFLTGGKAYPNSTLSLGWTTDRVTSKTKYSEVQIHEMLNFLRNYSITQNVTFAVRAAIAAESPREMKELVNWSNSSTLTLWMSNRFDPINITDTKNLIKSIGKNRIYLDVPADIKKSILSSSNLLTGSLLVTLIALGFSVFRAL